MEITGGTIARTVILALALINQILSSTGHPVIPIPNEDIETLFSTGFTILMAIIAWWKNNSFTKAARMGDFQMRKIKREAKEANRLNHVK